MPNNNAALIARLEEVTQAGLPVSNEALGAVVHDIVEALRRGTGPLETRIYEQMQEIVGYVTGARRDVSSLGGGLQIPDATDELTAVVAATEEATGKMLDVAEQLGELACDPAAAAFADRLNDLATNIYEASNFQDVTGQRLSKVIKALQAIETKTSAMLGQLGKQANVDDPASLLNGPQLPHNAANQDDIDALFDSL